MPTSEFRNRGLRVVVDTTEQAEFDFASHQIPDAQQELIARNLKTSPKSPRDRYFGDIRIREVLDGWDVAFVIGRDGTEWVVLVIGLERSGEMETHFEKLVRAGLKSLPPGAQELLKDRKRRK